MFSSQGQRAASGLGVQVAAGTTPSLCFYLALALKLCSPALWDVPITGRHSARQAAMMPCLGKQVLLLAKGALCASPLFTVVANTVLSDPVLLGELEGPQVACGSPLWITSAPSRPAQEWREQIRACSPSQDKCARGGV